MVTIQLDNASLVVQENARYDLTVFGPDAHEHHITGHLPRVIQDVRLARGVFQAMTDRVLQLYYVEMGVESDRQGER